MKEQTEKIIETINLLKPFIINEGGNLEFIKYENNIVYVKISGACLNCNMFDITLKEGIEATIKEEVPSVIEVVNIN